MTMATSKRSVLITGCSDGGLGAALAAAFHSTGSFHVYATARNLSKMAHLSSLGIETLILDVVSETSIAECVKQVPSLNILVNNAGAGYSMPFSDLSIPEAKKIFDLNLWSYIAVTQAFLPLILKSKGMIVNNTSVESVLTIPFKSIYAASKAAMASVSEGQRLELQPFGITVVELKTAAVKSNLIQNLNETSQVSLPKGSIYEPAKEAIEAALRQDKHAGGGIPSDEWAAAVVRDLLKKTPPKTIWRGSSAGFAWFGSLLPRSIMDGSIKKLVGIDILEQRLQN